MNNDINGTQEYFIRYKCKKRDDIGRYEQWVCTSRSEFYFEEDYTEVTLQRLLQSLILKLYTEDRLCNIDILSCSKV